MKKFLILILFIGLIDVRANAQKTVLDSAAIFNWPVINGEEISANGKYVLYLEAAHSTLINGMGQNLIIKSTSGKDCMAYTGVLEAHFSTDGRYLASRTVMDSLLIINLQTKDERRFADVTSFQWAGGMGQEVIAFKARTGNLRVIDMGSRMECSLKQVKTFGYGINGKVLFAVQGPDTTAGQYEQLHLVNLDNGHDYTIWTGKTVGKVIFNEEHKQLLFFGAKETGKNYSIWRYGFGDLNASLWVSRSRDQKGDSVTLAEQWDLGLLPEKGGIYFYVRIVPDAGKETNTSRANVRIWRYDNEFEGSDELPVPPAKPREYFLATAYPGSSQVVIINSASDAVGPVNIDRNPDYPFALVKNRVNELEGYRLKSERPNIYLVNLRDGSRLCVARSIFNAAPGFSQDGRYVYWFNELDHSFYTYNIKNVKIVNVSAKVKFPLYDESFDEHRSHPPFGRVEWRDDDQLMLVNDRYDIWALDPDGKKPPVNLSNGYGRKKKIWLRFSYPGFDYENKRTMAMSAKDIALVCGFDERTGGNGFFSLGLRSAGDPKRLMMGRNVYYYSEDISYNYFPKELTKATKADMYLLRRMGPGLYPNLCVTSDFRKFEMISALDPQRRYNWLSDTLIQWRTLTGKTGRGILYKPEDFDPDKKYPVIFYFYERLVPSVNFFLEPGFSTGAINIPWFVSRGYLVFCPDIWYKVGDPGSGVYDFVISGAKKLVKNPWVNSAKMGIDGHSWGGFGVNYLITRTNLFAAAVSGSGLANMTSEYGLEGFSCCSGPANVENYQERMGTDLCSGLKNYIENSPVFKSNQVQTPLLMMANPADKNVSWEQGVEFFTVLKRLGKKVWMLEYPDEAHVVSAEESVQDYTRRLTEFFDYYLKSKTKPSWMTRH